MFFVLHEYRIFFLRFSQEFGQRIVSTVIYDVIRWISVEKKKMDNLQLFA